MIPFIIVATSSVILSGFLFALYYTLLRTFREPEFIPNRVALIERKYIGKGVREGLQYIITLKVKELNRSKSLSLVKILDVYTTTFSMLEIVAIEGYEMSVDTIDLQFPHEPLSDALNPHFLEQLRNYQNQQAESFANNTQETTEVQSQLNIDDILDKINKTGKESLTPDELEFLNKISDQNESNTID